MKFHYNDEVIITDGFYKGTEGIVKKFDSNFYDVEINGYKIVTARENELEFKDLDESDLACKCILDRYETLYQIIRRQVKDKFELDELLSLENELTLLEEQGELDPYE